MSRPEKSKQITQKMVLGYLKTDINFEDTKHTKVRVVCWKLKKATNDKALLRQ